MTRLDAARAELVDLASLLHDVNEASPAPWTPLWMSMQSLLSRQSALIHEIDLLQGVSEFEIRLLGGAELDHGIETTFLGQFLDRVQSTVSAIVQAVLHGDVGAHGQYPADVIAASRMRVEPSTPGSFVIHLKGPDRAAMQTLDGEREIPPFDEAVDRMLSVLQAGTDEQETDALRAAVADVGSHRAVAGLGELVRALATSGTSATLVQRSPFEEEPREARLPTLVAARLHEVLSRTHQTVETIHETGKLTGVSWTRWRFDLEVTRGQPPEGAMPIVEVLTGRIIGDIRDAVRDAFDQVVRAEIERTTTVTDADRREHVSYRLVGVNLVEGEVALETR